ncbi:MAG TPA: PilZ domain-containing protein [Pirellulales bacterium]|nr:PilZ domain-containing protein [Pirellulales bacterium]
MIDETQSPGKLIYQLLVEAKTDLMGDRRADVRLAFFRPVTIQLDDGERVDAFSRELSASGIGLVHNISLPPGPLELVISAEQGYSVRVRTDILWCQECGQGWFISGGQFIGVATVGS